MNRADGAWECLALTLLLLAESGIVRAVVLINVRHGDIAPIFKK
jgi:hypothetical protein